MTISLRAHYAFPVDRPPIENGVVTIDGERIASVGKFTGAEGEVRNLGDVALLPGLVNAHTHLELSDIAQPLGEPGMRLPDWIRHVLDHRSRRSTDASAAVAAGTRESLAAGVTAVGDIAAADVSAYVKQPPIDRTLFLEVIGFSRARAESAYQAAVDRLDTFRSLANIATDTTQIGLSPHAPCTVSPDLLTRLVNLAAENSLPVAMHLAESAEELELLATGTGTFHELLDERSMWDATVILRGSRPLDYLRQLARAPRALVIHGNYLARDEHEFLAAHADHMSLVYCPRTHAYFGHRPYPLAELLATGVVVALGTDSRASNPDLSVWEELRYVAATHTQVPPHELLKTATLNAARALGREHDCGSITPGKQASLITVAMPASVRGDAEEILATLFAGTASPSLAGTAAPFL